MIFCLPVQELNEWHFINYTVRVVDHDELLLWIIEYFLVSVPRLVQDEEVWGFSFPRSWVVGPVVLVDLEDLCLLFDCFCSFLSSCPSIIFIRIILFDQWRTIVLPPNRFIPIGAETSFRIHSPFRFGFGRSRYCWLITFAYFGLRVGRVTTIHIHRCCSTFILLLIWVWALLAGICTS